MFENLRSHVFVKRSLQILSSWYLAIAIFFLAFLNHYQAVLAQFWASILNIFIWQQANQVKMCRKKAPDKTFLCAPNPRRALRRNERHHQLLTARETILNIGFRMGFGRYLNLLKGSIFCELGMFNQRLTVLFTKASDGDI